jgi:hypothetical protein
MTFDRRRRSLPGFAGVDYPLAPRTFFVKMNLSL